MENKTIQTPIQGGIPNQPSKRIPVLSLVLIFIALLLLSSTVFLAYQNIQLQKQIAFIQIDSTPSSVLPKIDNTITICKDFDAVTDSIKASLAGNYKTTTRDLTINDGLGFEWRRNSVEPVINYPSQKNRIVYLYGQPADLVSGQFEESYSGALQSVSLIKNDLNFNKYTKSTVVDGGLGSYGFIKGNDYYLISLTDVNADNVTFNSDGTTTQETQLPKNSSGINIKCGVKNPSYDEIYNKIIKKGTYSNKYRIGIIEIKDGAVALNVAEVGGFGGFASYWLIKDNSVEELVKGMQETPPCDIFELKKVGKGMRCYDLQAETDRTVTY